MCDNFLLVRLATRFVAALNLGFIVVTTCIIMASALTEKSLDAAIRNLDSYYGLRVVYGGIYAGPISLAIVIAIDLGAAFVLLRCTSNGVDQKQSLERSWLWIYVNVIFLVLGATFIVLNTEVSFLIVETVMRAVSLLVVLVFIRELGTKIINSPTCIDLEQSSLHG